MNPRSKLKSSLIIPPLPLASSFSSPPPTKFTSQPSISFSQLENRNPISGGSSTVYKDHSLSQFHQRCLRDMELLCHVHHPNLVNCHGFINQAGEFNVQFDYVDGRSLKGSHIHHEKELAKITLSRKEVKISDFALSVIFRHAMDSCKSSDIVYASPAMISTDLHSGLYDGNAGDIWSLGLCILQVYLGGYAIEVVLDTDWSLVDANCGAETPQGATSEFQDFIACCLQRDPTKRWTAEQLFHHPLVVQNMRILNTTIRLEFHCSSMLSLSFFMLPIKLLYSLAC